MSHSQFHSINLFILRHAWLNLWDKHMTTGRINQVTTNMIWQPMQISLQVGFQNLFLFLKSCFHSWLARINRELQESWVFSSLMDWFFSIHEHISSHVGIRPRCTKAQWTTHKRVLCIPLSWSSISHILSANLHFVQWTKRLQSSERTTIQPASCV